MIRHQQSGHDLALDDVSLHDFGDISFRADPVPDSFRINNNAGPHFAMVKAAGLVGSHEPLQIQPFCFALEMSMELFRPQVRATASGITFGSLVDADKNMSLKWRHGKSKLDRHGGRIEPLHQQPDILTGKQWRRFLRRVQNGHHFSKSDGGPEKFIAFGQFRSLAGAQFIVLGTNVPKITLEIFAHRTGGAIPFGGLIGGGGKAVIRASKEIFAKGELHERAAGGPTGLTGSIVHCVIPLPGQLALRCARILHQRFFACPVARDALL